MKKHAIITGAAGNLGRALTNALLDAGHTIHAIISHNDNTGYIIRSVVVVPGTIDTPQNRISMPDADFTKWVKPDEIARRIVQLALSSDMKVPDNILKIDNNS
jgi:NAD(P)-dependent dehydrogenase (short-subunit alcohol dehydrogenase family)